MRTIAHLSDLHFGTEDRRIAAALEREVKRLAPSLVVVSGDLTQRGRRSQFRAAGAFLERLPRPRLVVPGNHDVPLFDVARRFLAPLARYRRFIDSDLAPHYRDEEMAVFGLNTARSLTWKAGRLSLAQIEALKQSLCALDPEVFALVVTHHPFIPPPGEGDAGIDLVGRAGEALAVLDACQADLLLSGHLHHGFSGDVRGYYPATSRSIVVAQAGTAISRRLRGEPNAFNWIELERSTISITVREWDGEQFAGRARVEYRLVDEEWRPA